MDARLVAWARAVKSRHRHTRPLPPLWLFTDADRMPDPAAVVLTLPFGLCGVVFRHDAAPDRGALARRTAVACRRRRAILIVAGSAIPGLRAPGHRRSGRGHGTGTASAHGVPELVRAGRSGAAACFLSPVFPTASHPGAQALGVLRWASMARRAGCPVMALGGIDGRTVRRLPCWATGAGAIGALLPPERPL